MPQKNDSQSHAFDLAKLVNPDAFSIQLTCLNSTSSEDEIYINEQFIKTLPIFTERLRDRGIEYDVQLSKGRDIKGGCGQLATKRLNVLQ